MSVSRRARLQRQRRITRAVVRRRVVLQVRELWRVRGLAERSLPSLGSTFVFLCSRCAQRGTSKRVRIVAQMIGLTFEHELPVCDAFSWAFGAQKGSSRS